VNLNLKRLVEQQDASAQYYDLGRDFFSFTHTMDSAEEAVKIKFEQAIASKLKGKKIRARASRGYKQFEKDYEINAVNVSIDDYYDNYVVVVKSTDNKEYFLKPGFKVQIIGPMEAEKPKAPKKPFPFPKKPAASQPTPTPTNQLPTRPVQETASSNIKSFSIVEIERDLERWLRPLLMNSSVNLKLYIPRPGVYRTEGRKTTISYGVAIPINDVPGLTIDQIKDQLNTTNSETNPNINSIYTLEKFDANNDKYIIIIKKTLNY
jgi:hypothetical protein